MRRALSSFLAAGLFVALPAKAQDADTAQKLETSFASCLDQKIPEFSPWATGILKYKQTPASLRYGHGPGHKQADTFFGVAGRGRYVQENEQGQLIVAQLSFRPESNPFDAPGVNHESFYPFFLDGVSFTLERTDASQKNKDAFHVCASVKDDNSQDKNGNTKYALCVRSLYNDIALSLKPESKEDIEMSGDPAHHVKALHTEQGFILVNSDYGVWPVGDYPMAFKLDKDGELSGIYVKNMSSSEPTAELPSVMIDKDNGYSVSIGIRDIMDGTSSPAEIKSAKEQVDRMNAVLACTRPVAKDIQMKGYAPRYLTPFSLQ